jgi:hypothetical protein
MIRPALSRSATRDRGADLGSENRRCCHAAIHNEHVAPCLHRQSASHAIDGVVGQVGEISDGLVLPLPTSREVLHRSTDLSILGAVEGSPTGLAPVGFGPSHFLIRTHSRECGSPKLTETSSAEREGGYFNSRLALAGPSDDFDMYFPGLTLAPSRPVPKTISGVWP